MADLTPLGSERAGNADGTIPAWTGGLTSPPEGIGYEKGKHLPDPFADDKVLFTVSAENADQYDDYITRGQRALMERHNSYFLNVYPTRRSCAQPEYVYKAARRNAAVGELSQTGTVWHERSWPRHFQYQTMLSKSSGTILLRYRGF